MFWLASPVLARTVDRAGPAGNHPLPVSPKMPTVPGRLQPAASSGVPVLLNAAAVRPVSPQARPAAVLATVLTRGQVGPRGALPVAELAPRRPWSAR